MKINRSTRSFILLWTYLATSLNAYSQQVVSKNYSTLNGLSSNEVYDIIQDNNGLLWFATDGGVCSYNGYQFKQYGINDGLTSTTVLHFFPQKDGSIWCTTITNELFYFNPNDCLFKPYKFNASLSHHSKGAINKDLKITDDGSLQMSYLNCSGYIEIDKSGKVIKYPNRSRITGQPTKRKILINDNGLKYVQNCENCKDAILTKSEFYYPNSVFNRYDLINSDEDIVYIDSYQMYFSNTGSKIKIIRPDQPIIASGKLEGNKIWVGFLNGGASVYDYTGKELDHLLDGESVSSIIRDHENNLWVGTISSGVYSISNPELFYYNIGEKGVHKIRYYDDAIRVQSNNGGVFDIIEGEITELNLKSEYPILRNWYNDIGELIRVHDSPWNPSKGPTIFKDGQVYSSGYITNISDESNSPPVLSTQAGFHLINKDGSVDSYLCKGRINDACYSDNQLYLAKNNGLFRFDFNQQKEIKVDINSLKCRIVDIDKFRSNSLAIATRGQGVLLFWRRGCEYINSSSGLSSNIVSEVYVENDSTIWACTNRGLNKIVYTTNNIKVTQIGTNEIPEKDIKDVLVQNGTIWIGTKRGLYSLPINYSSLRKSKSNKFLRINEIQVNNSTVENLNELNNTDNRIEFNYLGVSYSSENKLYRYKLVGLENDWNQTKQLKVTYESLQPGKYEFILQAGFNGIWDNDSVRVPFVIPPPYYKTWWFKSSIVFMVLGIIYLFFRYRILTYNRNIIREILRHILKRISKTSQYLTVKTDGKTIKINSADIRYVHAHRNYIEIVTNSNKVLIREKLSNFLKIVPDPIEYIQINRSCIVRIDAITAKTKTTIQIGLEEFNIGNTYADKLTDIEL